MQLVSIKGFLFASLLFSMTRCLSQEQLNDELVFYTLVAFVNTQTAYLECTPKDINNVVEFLDAQNDVRAGFPNLVNSPATFQDLTGGNISNTSQKIQITLSAVEFPNAVEINRIPRGALEYKWSVSLTGSEGDRFKIGVFSYSTGEDIKTVSFDDFNIQVFKNENNIGGCGNILKTGNSFDIVCDKSILTDLQNADQNNQFNVFFSHNTGAFTYKDCY